MCCIVLGAGTLGARSGIHGLEPLVVVAAHLVHEVYLSSEIGAHCAFAVAATPARGELRVVSLVSHAIASSPADSLAVQRHVPPSNARAGTRDDTESPVAAMRANAPSGEVSTTLSARRTQATVAYAATARNDYCGKT